MAKEPAKGILPLVYHVCLGYAALEEAVGVLLGECVHLQRAGEVSAQCDHFVIGPAQLRESCSETRACILVSCIYEFFHHCPIPLY